jgi:hypothetical protein
MLKPTPLPKMKVAKENIGVIAMKEKDEHGYFFKSCEVCGLLIFHKKL